MADKPSRSRRLILVVLLLLAGGGATAYWLNLPIPGISRTEEPARPGKKPVRPKVELAQEGTPHTIIVPDEVRRSLGIRKGGKDQVATVVKPTGKRPLYLSGSTMLDIHNIHRIKARFAPCEVVRIEPIKYFTKEGTQERRLQIGDFVAKGAPLCVCYSVDVASKKNDLIDALVNYKFDNDIYQRAKDNGALPAVIVEGFRKAVQSDENAMKRALKNLKLWDIPKEDIDAVYREADEIIKNDGKRKPEAEKADPDELDPWGKVVLRAPFDGFIVEQNIAEKEIIVDPTVILYQVASTDKLLVTAHCPEEQVKELYQLKERLYDLKQDTMRWTLRPMGTATDGITGPIEEIGQLVDPNMHTVPLRGRITNKDGILRAGQYVTATIELPPPRDVVEVPAKAIADDGKQAIVFVQADAERGSYTMRRVVITHRFEDRVFVRSQLSDSEKKLTPEEKEQGLLPKGTLQLGEQVLVSGLLGLKKELEDIESEKER